jgi:hypothetical protein
MLETVEPFASIPPKQKTRIVHRESLIVAFEPDAALGTLPKLSRGRTNGDAPSSCVATSRGRSRR